jgi:hypothetical protein
LQIGAPAGVFYCFTSEMKQQDAIVVVSPWPVPLFGIYKASQDTDVLQRRSVIPIRPCQITLLENIT